LDSRSQGGKNITDGIISSHFGWTRLNLAEALKLLVVRGGKHWNGILNIFKREGIVWVWGHPNSDVVVWIVRIVNHGYKRVVNRRVWEYRPEFIRFEGFPCTRVAETNSNARPVKYC